VTLEELAGAYATIANGGRPVRVHALAEADAAASGARVGEASEWSLVTDVLADAHARARAFGVASLLRTSFPSAVKTGTSSDFRDTWTVGFTADYTVAAWVGNFDGAPMQRVSGVTGAAPLWNRIVRRLAERTPPAAFSPPRGYVRKPMCATTGVRPTRECDSIVGEWLDARDLVAWNAPPRQLDRTYDAWLAAQPPHRGESLRIVAPHDGDVFVAAPGARIAVAARGASRPAWELNGTRIAARDARWMLPLARGRWTLRVRDGAQADSLTFTVGDPLPRTRRAGFTIRDLHLPR
ncbi:MAG TPA: penicillin-binding transpeptidase domain-containing protein, partial [Candidatus Elarobacter sp.]